MEVKVPDVRLKAAETRDVAVQIRMKAMYFMLFTPPPRFKQCYPSKKNAE